MFLEGDCLHAASAVVKNVADLPVANQDLVAEWLPREVLTKGDIFEAVLELGQILDVDGDLVGSVVEMEVHNVEDFVVVVGPSVDGAVDLEAGVVVQQNGLEAYIPHGAVLDVGHCAGSGVVRD